MQSVYSTAPANRATTILKFNLKFNTQLTIDIYKNYYYDDNWKRFSVVTGKFMNQEILIRIVTPLGHYSLISHACFWLFDYVLLQETTLKQI